jgi:hypothetical protein
MSLEGGIAILAGLTAGSVALIGFGLDSAIEGFASAIIVWRFTGHRVFSEAAETRAQKLVALQFFVLAPYVGYESVAALVTGERSDVSWVGIGLAASSLAGRRLLRRRSARRGGLIVDICSEAQRFEQGSCRFVPRNGSRGLIQDALAAGCPTTARGATRHDHHRRPLRHTSFGACAPAPPFLSAFAST